MKRTRKCTQSLVLHWKFSEKWCNKIFFSFILTKRGNWMKKHTSNERSNHHNCKRKSNKCHPQDIINKNHFNKHKRHWKPNKTNHNERNEYRSIQNRFEIFNEFRIKYMHSNNFSKTIDKTKGQNIIMKHTQSQKHPYHKWPQKHTNLRPTSDFSRTFTEHHEIAKHQKTIASKLHQWQCLDSC